MEIVPYLGRAYARVRNRGIYDVSKYSLHRAKERVLSSLIDMKYGKHICRTDLNNSEKKEYHTMVHSDYHVLRDIFRQVPLSPRDVLVDVGCGEGRVLNFWLSLGLPNRIIGMEINEAVAGRTRQRYAQYPNVSVIHGDAVRDTPRDGTVFYLYNPFSDELMARFEEAVRGLPATLVYYNNRYMEPFQNGRWSIRPITSGERIYEYQAAVITPARGRG